MNEIHSCNDNEVINEANYMKNNNEDPE